MKILQRYHGTKGDNKISFFKLSVMKLTLRKKKRSEDLPCLLLFTPEPHHTVGQCAFPFITSLTCVFFHTEFNGVQLNIPHYFFFIIKHLLPVSYVKYNYINRLIYDRSNYEIIKFSI